MAKPFDLEKAKAGAKVLHKGQEVRHIGLSSEQISGWPTVHVIEEPMDKLMPKLLHVWEDDLTMAPVKVVKYINLYPSDEWDVEGSVWNTEMEARREADRSRNALVIAHPIEVEE